MQTRKRMKLELVSYYLMMLMTIVMIMMIIIIVIIIIIITPRSRVIPEKLTGPQLVKKFPTFYGNQGFITAFTIASHLSHI
jgi:prepilin signal peptidase PulO-like enzyme (type II secretory pathway)